jgi:hypothetical protein
MELILWLNSAKNAVLLQANKEFRVRSLRGIHPSIIRPLLSVHSLQIF